MDLLQALQQGSHPVFGRSQGRNGQREKSWLREHADSSSSGTQAGATNHFSAFNRSPAKGQRAVPDTKTSRADDDDSHDIVHESSRLSELQSAEAFGGLPPIPQPTLRPLNPVEDQPPTSATPLQSAIPLCTEEVDTMLDILLAKEDREYSDLRNGYHMLRTHLTDRFEGFVATMVSIALGVGTGGGISFSDPCPMAMDVLILAFVFLGRYLVALAEEGLPSDEDDDVLPATLFRTASKLVGAGAETTAVEVLAACDVRDTQHVARLKSRMNALEFEVGSKLKWMLNAATPTEFIHLFLSRAVAEGAIGHAQSCSAQERATTTAFEWARLGLFADFKPSELASAAVYRAVLCEHDLATARKVVEADGSGIPDLLHNARFSVLLGETERPSPRLCSPEPMVVQAVDAGLGAAAGTWGDGARNDVTETSDYDTEEPTPPSAAGWTNSQYVFFQENEVGNHDITLFSFLHSESGSNDSGSRPGSRDFVVDTTGQPEATGDSLDGTSMAMFDSEELLAPTGQGSLAEESAAPLLDERVAAGGERFGNPLQAGIENTAPASGAVVSAHHPVTPGTRRCGNDNGVLENGQQVAGSDDDALGWMEGFLRSLVQEEAAGPGAATTTRPVCPTEGVVCAVVDSSVFADGSVSDESELELVSAASNTTPGTDFDDLATQSASSSRPLPPQVSLLIPSAVVIDCSSREAACRADPTPRDRDIEARWERAALRRLDEGVEAYRRQQQESSMVRWGPGGLLVPVA